MGREEGRGGENETRPEGAPPPTGGRGLIDSSFSIPWVVVHGPFLVGGAICLVNSDNERDSGMLTSYATPERSASPNFLEGQVAFSHPRLSNNRSVMPLDVRGCTRATLTGSACAYPTPAGAGNPLNPIRDGDRGLQLFPMNEEFPVSAGHKLALIKSLPFVHTARRYYRLDGLVRPSDRPRRGRPTALAER
ncbi:TPA: hypothetical protein BOS_23236 [Bos taurus]|nr:TPA: hypothetical protein BOS_23236 [Bos taurus]